MRWLDEREDPRTLGALRIALGVCLLGDIASLLPHLEYLYGDAGVWPAAAACGEGVRGLSLLCHVPADPGAALVFALACAATLAFTLGIGTRVIKWVTAYLFLSIVLRNNAPMAGQQVLGNFLFLLCLSRCGAAYSLDDVLRRRRLARRGALDDGDPAHASVVAIPAWPRRLMIFQLCVLYCVAGWSKTGATYHEGTSFYYLVATDRWHRFPPWWVLHHFGDNLMRLATWTAWWFERLFPLVAIGLLLRRRLGDRLPRIVRVVTSRWIWASLAIAFTGSLLVFANIGWFVPATLAATLVLFRGEEIGGVVDRLLRRRSPPLASHRAISRTRLGRGLLAAFIAWHALAVVVDSLPIKRIPFELPPALRSLVARYGAVTNTWQFWGMFSPSSPQARLWLAVDVTDERGATHAAFDDRALLGERRYPYVGVDRRQKIHSNILTHEVWQRRHLDHVCRTWVGPEGEAPELVTLRKIWWRLPRPEEMVIFGPRDPGPELAHTRGERTLKSQRCRPDPGVEPEPADDP